MRVLPLFAGLALLAGLAACGGEDPTAPATDAGCQGTACGEADASAQVDGAVEPLPDSGLADSGQPEPDAGIAEDAGQLEDGGTSTDAGAQEPTGAIPGYLACDDDSECPVGYGNCISAVPLNRRDSTGTLAVRVGDLDPSLTKAGVCSLVCTTNPAVCDSLAIKNLQGERVPYACQLVVSGAPVYPSPRPAFPFTEQLSAQELQAGLAFGALCRPPFGLSAKFDDAFCAPCSAADGCGEGLCWSFARWDEVEAGGSGECLVGCADHPDCPFGFSCESLSSDRDGVLFEHGSFCVPFEQTCGTCRDFDGDGRGLGRCGPDGAVLGADCDDHDPLVYYDAAAMTHPFPEHCGAHDFNCNGLSDDAEQIGPAGFPAEHCTGCNQPCAGPLPNATSACVWDHAAAPSCVAECSDPSAWADCDGLVENGCEQAASDPTRLYYLDADSDGYGAGEPVFACEDGLAPEGYVNLLGDCDEANADIHPGVALDHCNGLDDDCDGEIDEDAQNDAACNTGLHGICAAGLLRCHGSQGMRCDQVVLPTAELCNGLDDDCDGMVDEEAQGTGVGCTIPGLLGVCAAGEMACDSQLQQLYCAQTVFPAGTDLPDDGTDTDCDGFDGSLATSLFVHAGAAEGGDGSRESPVRTVAQAMALVATNPGKRAVFFSGAQYDLQSTLALVNGVSLYGSRSATDWRPSQTRTFFVRTTTNPTDADHLVGIDGLNIDQPTTWKSIDLSFPSTPAPRHVIGLRCSGCSGLKLVDASISSGSGGNGSAAGPTAPAGANGLGGGWGYSREPGEGGAAVGQGGAGGRGGDYPSGAGESGQQSCGLGGRGGAGAQFMTEAEDGGAGGSCLTAAPGGGSDSRVIVMIDGGRAVLTTVASGAGSLGGTGGGGGGEGGPATESASRGDGGSSGGAGGPGGAGGGNGGSSVGLLLFQSNGIAFDGVMVNGGSGGIGGAGANGGKGGDGGPRDTRDGGGGGAGAGGGGGGGGAGGNSYGVLRDRTTGLGASGLAYLAGSAGQGGQGGQGGAGGAHGESGMPGGAAGQQGLNGAAGVPSPDMIFDL